MPGARWRSGAAALALLLVAAVPPARAQEPAPPVTTMPNEPAGWILVDADTGGVLGGREVRAPHLPASTIKLFTALVAVQRLPADEPIPISAHAAGMPARRIAVGAGQTWDLEDLLASMLTVKAVPRGGPLRPGADIIGSSSRWTCSSSSVRQMSPRP